MKIKICGITNPGDAEAAIEAGADLLGFVFRQGTPRALDPADSGWIRDVRGVERVGVFLDAPLDEVLRVRELLALELERTDAVLQQVREVVAESTNPRHRELLEEAAKIQHHARSIFIREGDGIS